jgi:hypothetical protein
MQPDIHFEKEVRIIKVFVFPVIPIVIIAALALKRACETVEKARMFQFWRTYI